MKLIESHKRVSIGNNMNNPINLGKSLDGKLTESVAYKPEIIAFPSGLRSVKAIGKSKPVIDDLHSYQRWIEYIECLDDNYIRLAPMMFNDNIPKFRIFKSTKELGGIHPIKQVQTTRYSNSHIFQLISLVEQLKHSSVCINPIVQFKNPNLFNIRDNNIGYPLTIYSYLLLCLLNSDINPYVVFSIDIISQFPVRFGCYLLGN